MTMTKKTVAVKEVFSVISAANTLIGAIKRSKAPAPVIIAPAGIREYNAMLPASVDHAGSGSTSTLASDGKRAEQTARRLYATLQAGYKGYDDLINSAMHVYYTTRMSLTKKHQAYLLDQEGSNNHVYQQLQERAKTIDTRDIADELASREHEQLARAIRSLELVKEEALAPYKARKKAIREEFKARWSKEKADDKALILDKTLNPSEVIDHYRTEYNIVPSVSVAESPAEALRECHKLARPIVFDTWYGEELASLEREERKAKDRVNASWEAKQVKSLRKAIRESNSHTSRRDDRVSDLAQELMLSVVQATAESKERNNGETADYGDVLFMARRAIFRFLHRIKKEIAPRKRLVSGDIAEIMAYLPEGMELRASETTQPDYIVSLASSLGLKDDIDLNTGSLYRELSRRERIAATAATMRRNGVSSEEIDAYYKSKAQESTDAEIACLQSLIDADRLELASYGKETPVKAKNAVRSRLKYRLRKLAALAEGTDVRTEKEREAAERRKEQERTRRETIRKATEKAERARNLRRSTPAKPPISDPDAITDYLFSDVTEEEKAGLTLFLAQVISPTQFQALKRARETTPTE